MKFSVSILCYNYGRFLARAITSVIAQEGVEADEVDILVVDDGSTDNTPEVCAAFQNRIRVLRSGNEGFAASLTKAIRHARGEYVCLLDADDYFAPEKLARIRKETDGGALYIDHKQYFADEEGNAMPGVHHGGNTSTICVHRETAMPLLPIENEVALQVILKAGAGVRLPDALTYYRQHGASMTDRKAPGLQNDYLAGVHHRLAMRLREMHPVPSWMSSRECAWALAADYESLGYYNELEASLERRQRREAMRACMRMLRAALGSQTGVSSLHAKMLVKTALMRPSFPKNG